MMLAADTPAKLLEIGAERLGILLSSGKIEKFLIYLEELKSWSKKVNLTALKKDENIVIKHFLDSLSCYLAMKSIPERLVDIGTGAGFPSLPLKILLPDIKCTLIEVKGKKTDFLCHLIRKLNMQDVTIVKARAEEMARGGNRESFDLAVGRAVAKFNILLEYALPYVKVGGYLIAHKGKDKKEIKDAKNALLVLGGKIEDIKQIKLPFLDQTRNLVLVQKVKNTPLKYPRRVGIPKKRPL